MSYDIEINLDMWFFTGTSQADPNPNLEQTLKQSILEMKETQRQLKLVLDRLNQVLLDPPPRTNTPSLTPPYSSPFMVELNDRLTELRKGMHESHGF
jgi:uncharacterized coiled-coil protein SlyX